MNKLIILEKRLTLLKESFDAGVIDAEEYRRNKEKIEKEIEKTKQQESAEDSQAGKEPLTDAPKEKKIQPTKDEKPAQEEVQETTPEQEAASAAKEQTTEPEEEKPEFHEQTPEEDISSIIGQATEEQPEHKEEGTKRQERPEPEAKKQSDVDILIEEAEVGPKEYAAKEDDTAIPPIVFPPKTKKAKDDHTLRTALGVLGAIIVLGLLVFFSINLGQLHPNETTPEQEERKPIIMCYQHADCLMPGMESKCVNGGKSEASCQYQNATLIELTIIGSGECASCSSERVKNILLSWFPGANVKEVTSSSAEGKTLRSQHGIEMLPAYVLDANVEKTLLFEDVTSALRKSGNNYVVKDSASGAPLFLNRNGIAGQVDVFLAPEDDSSQRAILNLEEFAASFGDGATLVYHVVKDLNVSKTAACVANLAPQRATEYLLCDAKSDEDCVAKLGLGTAAIDSCVEGSSSGFIDANTKLQDSLGLQVPSFLINNRMRIGGVQAADTLREQFCSMNTVTACSKELKKSLV